jgi:hypothetical protein
MIDIIDSLKMKLLKKNNEWTTPGKILEIFSMICLFCMRKEKRWQEEKPEKH